MKRFLLKFVKKGNILIFPAKYFKNVQKIHLLKIHLNSKTYKLKNVKLKRYLGNTKYITLSKRVFKEEDLKKASDYILVEAEYF